MSFFHIYISKASFAHFFGQPVVRVYTVPQPHLPPFLWSAVESTQSLNLIVCPHFCGQRPFLWLEISGTVPWLAWWYNSPNNLPTQQWGHFCGRQWSRNFWNGPSAQ